MQESSAGERKDRIRVYPIIVLFFYKRQWEGDAMQSIVIVSYCEPALSQAIE